MKITILGSGTSTGVPVIGCQCKVCVSDHPKNKRSRASIFVEEKGARLLVDTSTDFREQVLRHKIDRIDAVLYTHAHADHIHGIDDLRSFNVIQDNEIPVYADEVSAEKLKKYFDYIFCDCGNLGFIPRLQLKSLQEKMDLFGVAVESFPLLHGKSTTYGFRFGKAAYLTDVKTIPEESYKKLKNLDLLILDALRYKPHPTHLSLSEALAEIEKIEPKRTVFTHITHDVDYEIASRELPENVELAYDGMVLEVE